MTTRYQRFLLLVLILSVLATRAAAYNVELHWKTISTEHFDVHFHEGEEWTAEQVALIAEEIYPHITGLYQYEPKRCHFVILDTQDYANGAAFFYDNKVEIWATNLEFGYRGTTEWLRNVVTHEYTHIVSIQAAMKMPLRIPALYFQMIAFEEEKRPDVITGYPNFIGSYPVTGFIIPPWWAEGVSQYQSPTLQYDCWDSHRDMILRAALVDDKMASYDEMSFFGHANGGNEKVYDHGFGLVRFIANTYGPESIPKISESLGKAQRLTIDGALKSVTGKGGRELYNDWRNYLRARYDEQLKPVYAQPREGWILDDDGFMTTSPSFSPDGKKVALLSNKGSDFAATGLVVIDSDGKNRKRIEGSASSRAVFSPDGEKILYAAHKKADKWGAMKSDLCTYDFATKKTERLTHRLRASQPQYSPDGRHIVCIVNGDGTHQIVVLNKEGMNPRVVLQGEKGTQFYSPQYSPDGQRILFGIFKKGTRDIATIAVDGGDFRYLLQTENDERDARWMPDGSGIVFSSDRSGIFNVYTMETATGQVRQLTNVVGGAFTPDFSPVDGRVVYSGYNGRGYHVAMLESQGTQFAPMPLAEYAVSSAGDFDECKELKREQTGVARSGGAGSEPLNVTTAGTADAGMATVMSSGEGDVVTGGDVDLESHEYSSAFTDMQFFPRVVVWDGVPRLGAFMTTNEILDRQNFFVAGSYGKDGGYDFLVDFSLRRMFPVLYLSFFKMRQKYDDEVTLSDIDRTYFLDVTYDLWAAEMGLRFEWADMYSLVYRHDLSLWYSHSEYRVHIDPTFNDAATDPPELRTPENAVGWRYYLGNEFNLRYHFKSIIPAVDSDINPRGGREFTLWLMLARDELFTSGEFKYGLNPDLTANNFGFYSLDYHEYVAMPLRTSLSIRLRGAVIDNRVDDFFWTYIGGMDGIRGYTFYTLGGRVAALAGATYRFPIWRRINRQVSFLTFKDIYGGVFFEAANAWDHDHFEWNGYKRSAGYDIRLNMGSFYAYPLTINVIGAYALDRAVYINPNYESEPVVHEPAWHYYTTIGFTF